MISDLKIGDRVFYKIAGKRATVASIEIWHGKTLIGLKVDTDNGWYADTTTLAELEPVVAHNINGDDLRQALKKITRHWFGNTFYSSKDVHDLINKFESM